MGYALSWLAVRGKQPAQVLADLDATLTSRQFEFAERRMGARRLASGWYAVYVKKAEHPWVHEDWLVALSASAEVLACQVEEHLMFASADLWRNSARQWRVVHDGQIGRDHLAAEGALPSAYAAIAAEHRQLQLTSTAGVDHVFEVPLKLAQRLTGFKHDEGDAGGHALWDELSDGPTLGAEPARPWWKLW